MRTIFLAEQRRWQEMQERLAQGATAMQAVDEEEDEVRGGETRMRQEMEEMMPNEEDIEELVQSRTQCVENHSGHDETARLYGSGYGDEEEEDDYDALFREMAESFSSEACAYAGESEAADEETMDTSRG